MQSFIFLISTLEKLIANPCFVSKRIVISIADIIVILTAGVVNLLLYLGGTLNYMPDSANYVIFAVGIINDGGFPSSPVRLMGYPAFLAAVYSIFGENFLIWVSAIQHSLLVVCALAVKRITYTLTGVTIIATIAGLFSAFGLQLVSYASMPMTEVLYATLVTFSLLFAIEKNSEKSSRNLIAAITLASLATLVKPSALYFPFFLFGITLLRWTVFGGKHQFKIHKMDLAKFGVAVALFIVIVTPTMIKNKMDHGHFKLVAYLGQNLYSNTVEYGNFWDVESNATQEIKDAFEKWTQEKKAAGNSVNESNTWRNHWPATTAYLDITGKTFWDGDATFQRAAFDAIKKHPEKFVVHVLNNLRISLMLVESTVLYVPGYYMENAPKPSYLPEAIPLEWPDKARLNIVRILEGRGDNPMPKIEFSAPSIFTPIYGKLAHYYYRSIVEFGKIYFVLIVFGLCYATIQFVRTRDLNWIILIGAFLYFFVLPNFVVPGSPRHRLPSDPIIASLAAIGVLAFVNSVQKIAQTFKNRK